MNTQSNLGLQIVQIFLLLMLLGIIYVQRNQMHKSTEQFNDTISKQYTLMTEMSSDYILMKNDVVKMCNDLNGANVEIGNIVSQYECFINDLMQNYINKTEISNAIVCENVTAYTTNIKNHSLTADGSVPKEGFIALSRDLLESLGNGNVYGRKVYIPELGEFVIKDKMGPGIKKSIDIFMTDAEKCKIFGRQKKINVFIF